MLLTGLCRHTGHTNFTGSVGLTLVSRWGWFDGTTDPHATEELLTRQSVIEASAVARRIHKAVRITDWGFIEGKRVKAASSRAPQRDTNSVRGQTVLFSHARLVRSPQDSMRASGASRRSRSTRKRDVGRRQESRRARRSKGGVSVAGRPGQASRRMDVTSASRTPRSCRQCNP
jgi:hypothetical protein